MLLSNLIVFIFIAWQALLMHLDFKQSMNYKKILKYLYSLDSPTFKLGLDDLRALLNNIGNPDKKLKCIHVAGTNGKGSVCSMIYYALMEAGYKVGFYSSPHLNQFNERIRINEKLITDKEIVEYFLKIKPYITNKSFFEITTAMAFLYFVERNVDFLVLEVGLGGRLDATNVVTPLISVITNIYFEHTEILGKTIEKIAYEKAGIVKENVPVVAGANGKSLDVIRKIAEERNAPLFLSKKHKNIDFKYLNGNFQQQNKDIALAAIDVLKKFHPIRISKKQIINGIKKTRWKGRLEFISKNVLVDVAHNPAGMEVLKNELKIIKKGKNIDNFIFVIGIQKDKDIKRMLEITKPIASTMIFTKSGNPKAAEPLELLKIFNSISKNSPMKNKLNNKKNQKIIINPKKALNYAKKIAGKNDMVVVTGSIYMVGEVI